MRSEAAHEERDGAAADAVDTASYVAKLRRNAPLMAAIVAVITGAVTVLSLRAPKTYHAQTDVIVLDRGALTSTTADSDAFRRRLATLRVQVTTPAVLAPAAARLGVSVQALEDRVSASTDPEADVLSISAVAASARRAQRIANTVTRSFLAQQRQRERTRLRSVADRLSAQIARLRLAGAPPGGEALRALRERRAELQLAEAAVGSDLEIVRPADLPQAASAPRPLRNAILALFASVLIAVLVALAREQLRPRPDARELAELLAAPILVRVPENARRIGRARLRGDADAPYHRLAALLQLALPPDGRHSVFVASSLHGEGRTTVVQRLGAALAAAGNRTLVVSADVRSPDLDARYGVQDAPGLWDLLVGVEGRPDDGVADVIVAPSPGAGTKPDVLPSGARGADPRYVLDARSARAVLDAIGRLDYSYVLIDGPPLLGDVADAAVLATLSDRILIVARLTRLATSDAVDLREQLDFVGARTLGVVVVDPDAPVSSPRVPPARPAASAPPSGASIGG